jgi:acetyl-CoA acetyltransferase
MTNESQRACIVGVGETAYTKWGRMGDRGEWSLAVEAVLNAITDAGLTTNDIDGLASFSDDSSLPWLMQHALNLPALKFTSMVWGGGGSGACGAIAHAASAVESGHANYVAVLRSLCQGPGHRYGQAGGYNALPHLNFMAPFGMFAPPFMIAPLIQRYIHEYGAKPEHFAEVSLVCRDNAQRNPRAVMRGRPLTLEDYLNARIIASPLRLFDCCQENDGACALIVTTQERAKNLRQKPVRILAAAQGGNPGWYDGALGSHNMPIDEYGAGNGKTLAKELFGRAGITPQDVDVLQIYDHFTGLVLMSIENFGFCGRGEAGPFAAEGNLRWPNGRFPLNTSGGHLSEAYIHGLNLAVEGVRQLRGQSTSQVKDAEVCLVTAGLSGSPLSAALLGV